MSGLVFEQDSGIFNSLRWRQVGPFRGGRVVAVTGHPTRSQVFYFGSTGGGVWKTEDAGWTWHNISDGFFGTASVGAIAVAESDPVVIYVGMGESCIRGNVAHGDGVYRSDDGGKTWQHAGLPDTQHIARIRVHPHDANVVYVAALGHVYGPNNERGVFRSRDGGKTWTRSLFRKQRRARERIVQNVRRRRHLGRADQQPGPPRWHEGPHRCLRVASDAGASLGHRRS